MFLTLPELEKSVAHRIANSIKIQLLIDTNMRLGEARVHGETELSAEASQPERGATISH